MRCLARWSLALVSIAIFAQAALAWTMAGHMATGSIAYRVLKTESPKTIPKAVDLLKKNPYYGEKWKALIADLDDEDDGDELLFMLASRWADDARDDQRFYPEGGHKDAIHYINQPFRPEGQPKETMTNEPFEINIVRAYPELVDQAKNAEKPKDRAVALSWVMHLVGDAHQPLHTVSLYTKDHQLKDHGRLVGDRGGTWFYVKKSATAKKGYGLHGIWDGFLTNESRYANNKKDVLKLLNNPAHAPDKLGYDLKNLDIEAWVKESYELAKTKTYVFNGNLLEGGTTEPTAVVLPEGYLSASSKVAKVRGVTAGHRMAGVLRAILGN